MKKLRTNVLLGILISLYCVLFFRDGPLPTSLELRRFMWTNNLTEGIVVSYKDENIETIFNSNTFALTNSKYNNETYFPLASLSKPIASSAIRRLIKNKQLNLEDRLIDLLPDLIYSADIRYQKITVQQLLQHTAGFDRDLSGDDLFTSTGKIAGCKIAIKNAIQRPLDYSPGTLIKYSNTGYCLLQEILAHKTQTPSNKAISKLVLNTKELNKISLGPPDKLTKEKWSANFTEKEWQSLGAAGGWFAEAHALAHFYSTDARDSSINTKPTTPYIDSYYGLGWRVWPDANNYYLTHFGSLPGVFTFVIAHPDGRVFLSFFKGSPDNAEAASLELKNIYLTL